MTLCSECKAKIPTLDSRLRQVNSALHKLGLTYHNFLPVSLVDAALVDSGFTETSCWTFQPGHDARVHEEVGDGKWLSVYAHKMESGRWEITAYVN